MPDLIVVDESFVFTDTSAPPNGALTFTFAVRNQGTNDLSASPGIVTGFYASTDAVFDPEADLLLSSFVYSGLPAGSTRTEVAAPKVETLALGNYFLFVFVDRDDRYTETDETNNVSAAYAFSVAWFSPDDDDTTLIDPGTYFMSGGNDTAIGTEGNDTLYGQVGQDTIEGMGGDDHLIGGIGNDVLAGRADQDTVKGGSGQDVLYGGEGDDDASGGVDHDIIYGGGGDDTLFGDDGADTLYGEFAADEMFGGAGADTLFGGENDDVLRGNGGRDKLNGGDGFDLLFGGGGDDRLNGDAGEDTAIGGRGQDKLYGGTDDDLLDGRRDKDSLYGEDGSDALFGGRGRDRLFGGDGDDYLFAGRGRDILFGGRGADQFVFLGPSDSARTRRDADVIMNFQRGRDKIDLSAVEGLLGEADDFFKAVLAGEDPGNRPNAIDRVQMEFIGRADFAADGATGQVRYEKAGGVMVQVDINGDGRSDLNINIGGVNGLSEGAFIL